MVYLTGELSAVVAGYRRVRSVGRRAIGLRCTSRGRFDVQGSGIDSEFVEPRGSVAGNQGSSRWGKGLL
jgi:hypothetical protein